VRQDLLLGQRQGLPAVARLQLLVGLDGVHDVRGHLAHEFVRRDLLRQGGDPEEKGQY
jgi:hypothetical protein